MKSLIFRRFNLPFKRSSHGTTMIELPLVLWCVFIAIALPMVVLASTALRYSFLLNATREAVHASAQCKSFQQDYPPNLSAVSIAQSRAAQAVKAFNGIALDNVRTFIVISPVDGAAVQKQASKLATAADPEKNVYQIEVQLDGKANPLIAMAGSFVAIPGLTAPVPFTTTARESFENTQGLNR